MRLKEFFNIREATAPAQAERELNRSTSVFGRRDAGRQRQGYTADTGRAQAELDSAQSLVKREEAGAKSGLHVSGDKATLGALMDCLHEASSAIRENEDLADWAEQAYKAIAMGMRKGDTVTLPPFEETPDVDSFGGDAGIGPEEEY